METVTVSLRQLSLVSETVDQQASIKQTPIGTHSESNRSLTLGTRNGLHFQDSQSLPSFLPRSIKPAQFIRATVQSHTSHIHWTNCNTDPPCPLQIIKTTETSNSTTGPRKQVKAYQIKLHYNNLHSQSKHRPPPRNHPEIIVISSDEDDEEHSAKKSSSVFSKHNHHVDQDQKINIQDQPKHSTSYKLTLNLNITNQFQPDSNEIKLAQSSISTTNMIYHFDSLDQLLNRLKTHQSLLAPAVDRQNNREVKPVSVDHHSSVDPLKDPRNTNSSAPLVDKYLDVIDLEKMMADHDDEDNKDAMHVDGKGTDGERTTPTDEPTPMIHDEPTPMIHDEPASMITSEVNRNTETRIEHHQAHPSQTDRFSPDSDFDLLPPPRRISSIAGSVDESQKNSARGSQSDEEEPSIDFLNFYLGESTMPPFQDLDVNPNHHPAGVFGTTSIPSSGPPPEPPTIESNPLLGALGNLGLEQTELERELNEAKARHDFFHDTDPFHGHLDTSKDSLLLDQSVSVTHTQPVPAPSGVAHPTSSTPSTSPPKNTILRVTSPTTTIRPARTNSPDRMSVDIPVPEGATPDDSPAGGHHIPLPDRSLAGHHHRAPEDIMVPLAKTQNPVPGDRINDIPVPHRRPANPPAPAPADRSKDIPVPTVQRLSQITNDIPVVPDDCSSTSTPTTAVPNEGDPTADDNRTSSSTEKKKLEKGKDKQHRSKRDERRPVWQGLDEIESDPEDETYRPDTRKKISTNDDDEGNQSDDSCDDSILESDSSDDDSLSALLTTLPPLPAVHLPKPEKYSELKERNRILEEHLIEFKKITSITIKKKLHKIENLKVNNLRSKMVEFKKVKASVDAFDNLFLELVQDYSIETVAIRTKLDGFLVPSPSPLRDDDNRSTIVNNHHLHDLVNTFNIKVADNHRVRKLIQLDHLVRLDLENYLESLHAKFITLQSQLHNTTITTS